jgi:hypothetical protein
MLQVEIISLSLTLKILKKKLLSPKHQSKSILNIHIYILSYYESLSFNFFFFYSIFFFLKKKSSYYQGLNINGHKKKSWIIRYNPSYSNKLVEPSYLFYAAYYGNITSIRYFLSERPIKALERFAQKYTDNKSKDLRVTILNTFEDIQKVGRKLFNYELFRNETPFHWAVQNNEHDSIKELIRVFKEKESKGQTGYDEEQSLTLEEILDMRADERKITALLLAAQFGHNECIKALLEGGADPGITDCNGWSLAHYAVYV